MTVRLLHLGTAEEDAEWIPRRLAAIGAEMDISWKQRLSTPDTIAEIELQCKAANLQGVVCSNPFVLEKLLKEQVDFIPPTTRKQLTLDDYQGSLIHSARTKLPFVFINPLANFITVPYAIPAAKRFISKLAKPGRWFKATRFTWQIGTPGNLPDILARFEEATLVGVDIETIRDDPQRRMACVGFAAYFASTHTTEVVVIPCTDLVELGWIRKFCASRSPKVFQNGLYDNLYLLRWGCPVENWLCDTQHQFHSMYSEYPKRLSFIAAYAIRDIRYWKDDGATGNLMDFYRYNAKDAWSTVNSFLSLAGEMEDYAVWNYVQEFPLVFPCLTCEIEGFKMDMPQVAVVNKQLENEVEQDTINVQTMLAAPGFNVASAPQTLNLFKVLGLGHLPNTAKASMLKAKASSAFNNVILSAVTDLREDRKTLSVYMQPYKFWLGRCFYKLNPAATDTGRLNSTESSYWCGLQIQNITAKHGPMVKYCFMADTGWLLAEIDKAQAEARCVGYMAGEQKLINLVEGPHDYHAFNAQQFFGVPYDTIYSDQFKKTINKELRDLAKRTNHGANYNMGAGVMLETMGPKAVARAKVILKLQGSLRQVCQVLLDRYAATYPAVKGRWYDSIVREVQLTGRLVTPTGRTRIFFGKPWTNKRDLNVAVAHKPQSLNVDLLNDEFYCAWGCQIYGKGRRIDWKTREYHTVELDLRNVFRLKAQIHDSLAFQYKKNRPDIPQLVADKIMNTRIPIVGSDGVTREMYIPVDVSCGKQRWSELK